MKINSLKVYLLKVQPSLDCSALQFLLQFSPLEKRQRIMRQQIKQCIDNMTVGGALARYVLWREFGIPANARIAYGEFGKPYLPDYSEVYFNISHSGQFVACAVCSKPVGIDVQEIAPYLPNVAARVCSKAELVQIENSGDKAAEFTKIWTRKEAYLKMLGVGIGVGLQAMVIPTQLSVQTKRYQNIFISIVNGYLGL